MKKLLFISVFLVSTMLFSQEKIQIQTFEERLKQRVLTFRENFMLADSTFTYSKKYADFMKKHNRDLEIMQKYLDSFPKPKAILLVKKSKKIKQQ